MRLREKRPSDLVKENTTIALYQAAMLDLRQDLKTSHGVDDIRSAGRVILQELIEAETTALIGAHPQQRSAARMVQRNSHRPQTLSMTAGDAEVANPNLRYWERPLKGMHNCASRLDQVISLDFKPCG